MEWGVNMKTSESISAFAEAFVKFQEEVTDPKLDTDTDYMTKKGKLIKFKYASLPEILRTVRPVLTKCGIAVMQEPRVENNEVQIVTILIHKSGEWIEFEPLKMMAQSAYAQEIGSAITYGRRYNISSVLGLGSEEDDDGQAATDGTEKGKPLKEKSEPLIYVKQEGGEIKLLYPTKDDAVRYATNQKYLLVSGFSEPQCNYALKHNEYKEAFPFLEARIGEIRNGKA